MSNQLNSVSPVPFGWGNDCVPVKVEVMKELTDVDKDALIIAFFVGLIVGGLIALLCAKLCIKDIVKHKIQHEEERHGIYPEKQEPPPAYQELDKQESGRRRKKKKRQTLEDEAPLLVQRPSLGTENDNYEPNTLADAFASPNSYFMEASILRQDFEHTVSLDIELRAEKIEVFLKMVNSVLNYAHRNNFISDTQYDDLWAKERDQVNRIISTCKRECNDKIAELKKSSKLKQDLIAFQSQAEMIETLIAKRLNTLLSEERENLKKELAKYGVPDNEIKKLLSDLNDSMKKLDQKIESERERQLAALERKLERRRKVVEQEQVEEEEGNTEIDIRCDRNLDTLDKLVEKGKLLERTKEELLEDYERDCRKAKMVQTENYQKKKGDLQSRLNKRKEDRLRKLQDEQERRKQEFLRKCEKSADIEAVTAEFHKLLSTFREEREKLEGEFDDEAIEEFENLKRHFEEELDDIFNEKEVHFQESIRSKANLTQDEVDRLMKNHRQQMLDLADRRKNEQERIAAVMREKQRQRRLKKEEETRRMIADQQAIQEQENTTIQRLLDSQTEIDDESKKKILQEHKENMESINHQLRVSRMKQQKALDEKLANRRAKIASLKQDRENAKAEAKRDREKKQAELNKLIEVEEKRLQEEQERRKEEVRKRLSQETKMLLEEKEKEMAQLVGRIQASIVRYKARIEKDKKILEEMEQKVTKKVEESVVDRDDKDEVKAVLRDYQQNMLNLEDQMNEGRARQEQKLKEKIERRKLQKEDIVERDLQEELQDKRDEGRSLRSPTAKMASDVLNRIIVEQKHRAAMRQLEEEMQLEMKKQREELNREFEIGLKEELDNQNKSLLAQLALISNVKEKDMKKLAEEAAYEAGAEKSEAVKIAKDMKSEYKRARSSFGM